MISQEDKRFLETNEMSSNPSTSSQSSTVKCDIKQNFSASRTNTSLFFTTDESDKSQYYSIENPNDSSAFTSNNTSSLLVQSSAEFLNELALPYEHNVTIATFTYSKKVSKRFIIPTDYCHRTTLSLEPKPQKQWFLPMKVLGQGAYGTVVLVKKNGGNDDGKLYAMKRIVKKLGRRCFNDKKIERNKSERQILECIRGCPFLVQLHYAFQTKDLFNLVLEYLPGGELFTLFKRSGGFNESDAQFYIAEVILAIEQLHARRIIYRDLKLENILIDAEGHIVLTDFGLSKHFSKNERMRTYSHCGTTEYMAPELINCSSSGYSFSVDWWAVGVLLLELLTETSPFTNKNSLTHGAIKHNILNLEPTIPDNVNESTKSLIRQLLKKNPAERIGFGVNGAQEIKSHLYFKEIDWSKLYNKGYEVPYKPHIINELDTSHFENEFTDLPVNDNENEDNIDRTVYRNYSYIAPNFVNLHKLTTLPIPRIRQFELEHCSQFLKKYSLQGTLLGTGSFGITYSCISKLSTMKYAVKIFPKTTENHMEIEILKSFQHPNIVTFVDYFEASTEHFLVMESLEGGELFDRVPLTETRTKVIFTKIVSAVGHIHASGIIHGDLKLENILFVDRGETAEPKIIDFGYATYANRPRNGVFIPYTIEYVPPEMLKENPKQSFASDIWSLGISFCLMLTGTHPYMEGDTSLINNILHKEPNFPSNEWNNCSKEAKELAKNMLQFEMDSRPTINEILNDPWVTGVKSRKRTHQMTLRSKRLRTKSD